jgi:hypothetical protein
MRKLLANVFQTPDGTVLQSFYRHNYVSYVDRNGQEYVVDGGIDYIKRMGDGQGTDLSVYSDDPFEKIREWFGVYAVEKNTKAKWYHLKDVSNSTIENFITIGLNRKRGRANELFLLLLIQEKQYRNLKLSL